MGILFEKLFAQLLFWLYDFIDAVFEFFQVLCGIQPVSMDGGEVSLINVFLQHSTVTRVFLSLFILSIILVAVCACVSIVKSIVNARGGERKSHAKTVGQSAGAIITSLVMLVVMICFITVSNSALGVVQKSFNSNYEQLTFSQMLFNMSVESSYQYDYSEGTPIYVQVTDDKGNWVYETDEEGNYILDDNNEKIPVMEVQKDDEGNVMYTYPYLTDPETGEPLMITGWHVKSTSAAGDTVYYSAADINFAEDTPDDVFGVHGKVCFGLFESTDKPYKQDPMVELESFNMLTAYLVVIVMLVSIIWSMLGLVKRIFDLTFLLLAMPLICSTIPLDDGARFKTWRDTVTSKVLLAWGAVFSVNIFLLLVPIINEIDFAAMGWSSTGANIFKMFLMMGGALAINGGQLLAARLMGSDASESRDMAQSARALLGGVMAGGGVLRGAKNMIFGGQNKYGRQTKGMLRTAGGLVNTAAGGLGLMTGGAAKAANAIGTKVGGEKYTGSRYAKFNQTLGKLAAKPLDAIKKGTANIGRQMPIIGSHIPEQKSGTQKAMENLTGAINNLTNAQAQAGSFNGAIQNVSGTPAAPAKTVPESSVDGLVNIMTKPKDGDSGAFRPPEKGDKK